MSPAALIDANVPIYAAGVPHPLKDPCKQILLLAAERFTEFVTDAEVLQELLHRYLALGRWAQGSDVFRTFSELMHSRIQSIHAADVEQAALLADAHPATGARDLLHIAVMHRLGLSRIVSADRGFDGFNGVERLDPARLPLWRESIS